MHAKVLRFIKKKIHSLLARVKFKVVKNQFFQQKKFQDVTVQFKFNILLYNQFIAGQLTINTIYIILPMFEDLAALCSPPPKLQLNTEIPSQRVRNFFQDEQKGNLAEECESSSERAVECREGVNKRSVLRRCSRLSSLFADQSNTRSFNAALLWPSRPDSPPGFSLLGRNSATGRTEG